MPLDPNAFLSACARYGLFIDTNLLLLLIIGNQDASKITSHKLTCTYTEKEYLILVKLLQLSKYKLHITPYVVSEVSNFLIDNKNGKGQFYTIAKKIIEESDESHQHKDTFLSVPELKYLGFTDISIVKTVGDKNCGIATADSALYNELMKKGRNVIHLPTFSALGSKYIS